MTYNNDKAKQETANYIIANYNKIKVKSGKCRYNFRCQMNAVHEASKNKHKKIAMCVYLEGGHAYTHFINYNKGKFIDNTLGQWSSLNEYYFRKWIKAEDFWNVNSIFTSFREELKKRLSWWVGLTSDYTV